MGKILGAYMSQCIYIRTFMFKSKLKLEMLYLLCDWLDGWAAPHALLYAGSVIKNKNLIVAYIFLVLLLKWKNRLTGTKNLCLRKMRILNSANISNTWVQYRALERYSKSLPASNIEKLVKDPVLAKYSEDVLISNIFVLLLSTRDSGEVDWNDAVVRLGLESGNTTFSLPLASFYEVLTLINYGSN